MAIIQFADKLVTYDTFLADLAGRLAEQLASIEKQPEYISQRQAYSAFGRANVDRWRRSGKLEPHKRPGKIEYRTSELRQLKNQSQDYFI